VDRIFINCASYRDPDLKETVSSAFRNAMFPDKVFFGICWQGAKEELNHLNLDFLDKCRIVLIHSSKAQGESYARHKAMTLWEGEEFVLSVDSHSWFSKNWDIKLLEMLGQCPSHKSWLSGCLSDHTKNQKPFCSRVGVVEKFDNGLIEHSCNGKVKKLELGFQITGHFRFSPSKMIEEVPIDPLLEWYYYDIIYAARTWTSGWDLYHPHKVGIQHKWDRKYRKLIWDDKDMSQREKLSIQRYKDIFLGDYNGKYGLGYERTLEEYEIFSGIDFRNQKVKRFIHYAV